MCGSRRGRRTCVPGWQAGGTPPRKRPRSRIDAPSFDASLKVSYTNGTRIAPTSRERPRGDPATMLAVLGWYASIFCWLFFTGIGLPPCPEEAGILYAAGLHALHPEVHWPFAWLMAGLGILGADAVLYGVVHRWGPRLFAFRWVQRVVSAERRRRRGLGATADGIQ